LPNDEYLLHFIGDEPKWINEIPPLPEGSVVLDLGAGDGRFSYHIKKDFPGVRLICLDLSFLRCKRCKENVETMVAQADALEIPIKDETIDFLICNQLIEHIADEHKLLKEIRRVLRPAGGAFISSVLASRHSWHIYKGKYGGRMADPSHLREYASVTEFENLLKGQFEISKVSTRRPLFSLARHLVRILYKYRLIPRPPFDLFERNSPLRWLQKLKIGMPGYRMVEAFVKQTHPISDQEERGE
jgi:SAM-dependent methyltransferase